MLKKICFFVLILVLPVFLSARTIEIPVAEVPVDFCSTGQWTTAENAIFWSTDGCAVVISLYNTDSISAIQTVLSFNSLVDAQSATPAIPFSACQYQCLGAKWVQDANNDDGYSILDIDNQEKQILAVLIPTTGCLKPGFRPILALKMSAPVGDIKEGKLKIPVWGEYNGTKLFTPDIEFLPLPSKTVFKADSVKDPPFSASVYPNPFNPITNISFVLPEATNYSLKIYNIMGRLVRTYEGVGASGNNTITWDGKDNTGGDVSSGVYFYKLIAGYFKVSKKMILLK